MKMSNKISEKDKAFLDQIDALLGTPESSEDLGSELRQFGTDPEELRKSAFQRIRGYATQQYSSRGRDLPARDEPYDRAEIAEAVEALVPAIEIADCRWPADAPDLLKLADDMGNGAFIAGAPLRDWRSIDLRGRDVLLTLDGKEAARGPCAKILGDPLMGVVGLANAQPLPAGGLKRGQTVTTGTCITPLPLKAGTYVADFRALGRVEMTVE